MIYPGHLGSGLTLDVTGRDAFKMICRPDLEVAHTVSTASVSSDLIATVLKVKRKELLEDSDCTRESHA